MHENDLRLGLIGQGYGLQVLLPAFRSHPGVAIVAVAARDTARAEAAASAAEIPKAYGDWRTMLDSGVVDAIAVAVPPQAQTEIALYALERGIHVFAEKPMAADLASAQALARAAERSGCANVIDFNFRQIAAFGAARALLRQGAIGQIRHVAVTWQVESYANKARLPGWKADQQAGGGALFNFVSHSLDYLEDFAGPIRGLSARLAGIPGDTRPNDTFVALALDFAHRGAGSLVMSAAAYCGSGHRIEFYGEDGTLVLDNTTADYMRGFRLSLAQRPAPLSAVELPAASEADAWKDGRVLPVSRLVRDFVDWAKGGPASTSDFAAGLRVQTLLEAARLSSAEGRWMDCQAGTERAHLHQAIAAPQGALTAENGT